MKESTRKCIKQALRYARGEDGPERTGDNNEDARYVFPERIGYVIGSLEAALEVEDREDD